jgi:hypothetical protein
LSGYQARALFPFMGQTAGELSFNAGDLINLIDYSHEVSTTTVDVRPCLSTSVCVSAHHLDVN